MSDAEQNSDDAPLEDSRIDASSQDQPGLDDESDAPSSQEESAIEELELPPPAESEEDDADAKARGGVAAIEEDTAVFDTSELTAAPVPPTTRFGGPGDASDEQPLLVAEELGPPSELQQAYECLEIRTPVQEYESYVRARLEALIRLGRQQEADATSAALELGLDALRRAMGRRGKAGNQKADA